MERRIGGTSTSLLDPRQNLRQFQQHLEFALMCHEVVGGEDVGHHRARPGKRQEGRSVALSFDLQERVGQRRQRHMAVPPGKRSADEVVEPEFGLPNGVLPLDRPSPGA